MSVWALSLWPLGIWQEQSQAGVTAGIHLPVSCNRGGRAVCVCSHRNTHTAHQQTLKRHAAGCASCKICRAKCTLALRHACVKWELMQVCRHLPSHGKKWLLCSFPCVRLCVVACVRACACFQERVTLWWGHPPNVFKLSCPIKGNKWHVHFATRTRQPFQLTVSTRVAQATQ